MESIIRAAVIYAFLMIVIRITGHRTLNEMTTFDFVLLLIMGDASQQAMTGGDNSVLNAILIISTLIFLDLSLAFIKQKFPRVERIIDGVPIILINDGKVQQKAMKLTQVDIADILEAGRKMHGLERLEQIKYAILEKNGEITIIKT